jgi:hypothetical protein
LDPAKAEAPGPLFRSETKGAGFGRHTACAVIALSSPAATQFQKLSL